VIAKSREMRQILKINRKNKVVKDILKKTQIVTKNNHKLQIGCVIPESKGHYYVICELCTAEITPEFIQQMDSLIKRIKNTKKINSQRVRSYSTFGWKEMDEIKHTAEMISL
jgi:hypothetical protein